MKIFIHYLFLLIVMASLLLIDGCSGCTHRQRRNRERSIHRNERLDRSASSRDSKAHREINHTLENDYEYSLENIKSLSESNDYDAMLDALENQLKVLKQLKNEYFKGNMADRVAKEKIEQVNTAYSPIVDKLSKASSDGLLNYNQHKRQMKLVGEYIKLLNSIVNRIGCDLESQFLFGK